MPMSLLVCPHPRAKSCADLKVRRNCLQETLPKPPPIPSNGQEETPSTEQPSLWLYSPFIPTFRPSSELLMGVDYAHPSAPIQYPGASEMKEHPVLSSIKLGTLHRVKQGPREPSGTLFNTMREEMGKGTTRCTDVWMVGWLEMLGTRLAGQMAGCVC